MNKPSSPKSKSRSKRSSLLRWASVLGVGTAACGAALSVGLVQVPARAESPAAPGKAAPAVTGDMKPFAQDLPGATGVSFDLVPVPGGKFKMGSPDAEKKRGKDEGPQFEVAVDPFYMGKHEVTWDAYNEYLNQYNVLGTGQGAVVPYEKQADAVSYPTPIYDIEAGPALQRMGGRVGKFPATIVAHWSAKQYTKWLSAKTGRFYRLPTEAEWEYAARGGKEGPYHFGTDADQLEEHAWFTDNSELADGDAGYHEVGKKKPNPFGLHDMYGNVAEIVIDQYDPEWYKQFAGKSVSWRDAVRWPDAMYPRTAKGGGYESEAEELRSAARKKITVAFNTKDPQSPKSPYWWTEGFTVGFRVVSPLTEPTDAEKAKFWDVDSESLAEVLKRDREIRELVADVKSNKSAGNAAKAPAPTTAPSARDQKSQK